MLESVFSVSDDLDPFIGVKQVVADCRKQLGDRTAQAGLFYTSCLDTDYERMLAEICREFPGIELVGCTTDGEITKERGLTEDSSALLLMCSDDIQFGGGIAENISGDTESNMRLGYTQAVDKMDGEIATAFVLPDGLTTMDIPLDVHLKTVFGESLPVFGGTAGDGFELKQTYQFYKNQVYTDAMPILLLGGELDIAVSLVKGPLPYGDSYPVNEVAGNVVYTIDGVTALNFFERFMGKYLDQQEISFFPLAVYTGDSDDFYLRDTMSVNREDGSITFLGRFEEPCKVRLTQFTRDETLSSAYRGCSEIVGAFQEKSPELVFVFSCTSRKHVLGSRASEEFSVLMNHDVKIPFIGFYCYGEIGPFAIDKPVNFHSDTCIFVALRSSG